MAAEDQLVIDVREQVAELVQAKVREVFPDATPLDWESAESLDDLGLDSLARMDIVNAIEGRFGIRFNEQDLYDIDSPGDLVQLVIELTGDPTSTSSPAAQDGAAGHGPAATESSPAAGSAAETVPAETVPAETVPAEHWDVEQFPECRALRQRLDNAAAAGLANPYFRRNQAIDGPVSTIDGRATIRFTSFDYLGLATEPAVIAAAKQGIDRFGTSASASRLVGGENTLVSELDRSLARWIGTESAAVFPSGFGTNASVLGHLFGPDDLILLDELAHMSIVQGARLSHAAHRAFPHNDAGFVDQFLADQRGRYRRVAIAIEGVYSMDGDFPNLKDFLAVKRRHHALLYVDEAHSLGTMGTHGRGICQHFSVDPAEGDIWMGTISKALGSGGGYVAGRAALIDYLRYTTPSFVFATGASPANAAAALAALQILQQEPERVRQLRERAELFVKLAADCDLDTGPSKGTPIVPVILGDSRRCLVVSQKMLAAGVDVQPILYPAVPEQASRLRFFVRANHSEQQICDTVATLARTLAEC